MSKASLPVPIAALILVSLAFAAEEPESWKAPAVRPPLPALPDEKPELATRFASALQRMDTREKEAAALPKGGDVLQMLANDSPGVKVGLQPGDVLLKVDGTEIKPGNFNSLRKPEPQKLTYWRYGVGEKVIEIPPGKLGIWNSKAMDLTPPVPGPIKPDARWDDTMSLFTRLYIVEPELAQIGLLRAIKASYPQDALTDCWLAVMALNQGHYARAMDFASISLASSPNKEAAVAFRAAAIASNHVIEASEVVAKFPQFFPDDKGTLKEFAAAEAKLTTEQRGGPHALELAKTYYKEDVLLRAEAVPWFTRNSEVLGNLHKAGNLEWNAKTDYIYNVVFTPTATDVLVSAKIKLKQTRPGPVSSEPQFGFNATKYEGKRSETYGTALDVIVSPPRIKIGMGNGGLSIEMYRDPLFADPDREHDLTFAVCKGKTEVMFDGEAIFHCDSPVPDMTVAFSLINVGVRAKLRDVQIFELVTEEQFKTIAKNGAKETFRAGQSRLHRAAAFNLVREAQALLDAGADVNLADQDGSTPLHQAARRGSKEVVQLLLSKGAKPEAQDKNKATPAKLAHENGYEEIAKILGDNQPVKSPKPRPNEL